MGLEGPQRVPDKKKILFRINFFCENVSGTQGYILLRRMNVLLRNTAKFVETFPKLIAHDEMVLSYMCNVYVLCTYLFFKDFFGGIHSFGR